METIIEIDNRDIVGMATEYTHKIGMCPECELIITQNPFSQDLLSNRYKNFSKFEYDDNDDVFEGNDLYKKRMKRIKYFIEETIGLDNIFSIFEVGASSGFNLSLYSDLKKYGVEPSAVNVKNAKKRYGVDLFCGDFDEYMMSRNGKNIEEYDLVFLAMTLEHIVNPYDFISKLCSFNSKYMFIEVPTFDIKLNNEPFGMFCEEHVNMFTLKSLQKLMNKCGYQLVDADIHIQKNINLPAGFPGLDSIWQKVDNAKEYPIINNAKYILESYIYESKVKLSGINKVLDQFPNKKRLAVWGTGHHASMLYSNTTLCNKNIVKVYDSDQKKHGLIMFDCKIEPFNEEDIFNKNIDAVLIATYTARAALLKILDKYKKDIIIIDLYKE